MFIFILILLINIIGLINCFNLLSNTINSINTPIFNDLTIAGTSLTGTKIILDSMKEITYFQNNINYTRKGIHICAAPLFLSTWQFYDSKYIASFVPLIASFYLIKESKSISKILSRTGDNGEIFNGPLIYTSLLTLITIIFWKDNSIGMISMIQLSIGDGFSDIIGRKYGKNKWFGEFSNKSIEGSLGFFISSSFVSYLFLSMETCCFDSNYSLEEILLISFICSLSEVFSKIDDNISIPLAALLSHYILRFTF